MYHTIMAATRTFKDLVIYNYKKVISERQETILDLRLNQKYQFQRWGYKRFEMKHPNDMAQTDILGPFYLSNLVKVLHR